MLTELIEETLTPKLRGGYYTPPAIARFLAEWVIQRSTDTVLEPSCGDGELVAAAGRLLTLGATPRATGKQLRATELFESEARIARQNVQNNRVNHFCALSISLWPQAQQEPIQLDFQWL